VSPVLIDRGIILNIKTREQNMSIDFDTLLADLQSSGRLNSENKTEDIQSANLSGYEELNTFEKIENIFDSLAVEVIKNPDIDKIKNARSSKFLSSDTLVRFSELDLNLFLREDNLSVSDVKFQKILISVQEVPIAACGTYF